MAIQLSDIKFDCRHFKGEIPCKPNKLRDKVCAGCDEYDPIKTRVLIIKLGAIGDVIRSTPLAVRFKNDYPGCHISWITLTPEIVPQSLVDKIYPFDFKSIYAIQHQRFDFALNLDKDFEACSLLSDVNADKKFGYILKNNHIDVATPAAEHKLITGIYDNISKQNTKNYMEEIFEICGWDFKDEPYILDVNPSFKGKWEVIRQKAGGKKIVGLNTGCGKRWLTRLWPQEYWVQLIKNIQDDGYFPLLMGGPDEDAMNRRYAEETGAYYPGTFSLQEFISLSDECDVIVTAVSMMMHIAIALKKPLVLFNNIFNPHEFYMYNNGTLVQPPSGCDCYYGNTCKREHHCMKDLPVSTVYGAIQKYL